MVAGENIIVAIVTAVGTYLATQAKVKHEVKGKRIESDKNAEAMYVQNMELIMAGFREQVDELKEDVIVLKSENEQLRRDFKEFKKKYHREIDEYQGLVDALKSENEELKEEVVELETLIKVMEGD
ncbi:MAG: hypothetical protein L0K90_00380 [Staphylococcus equorum]|nr:hypothetical protein [Staphylococcus equorum]